MTFKIVHLLEEASLQWKAVTEPLLQCLRLFRIAEEEKISEVMAVLGCLEKLVVLQ